MSTSTFGRSALLTASLLAAPACLEDRGRGPYLGPCATYPDDVYTYGQIGVGTCLAGPADLQFYTSDGRTFAAITNADPFRNFTSGSLLVLDLDALDVTVPEQAVDDLAVGALPMDSFVGGFAVDPARARAYVTSRLSPDARVGSQPDKLWVVDLAEPTSPAFLAERPFVTVRQDPFEVTLVGERAFVLSPADASVAVVDLAGALPELYDPAPTTRITAPVLHDLGATSTAELAVEPIVNQEVFNTDAWTARWIEGSTRLWVPTEGGDLARQTSGALDAGPTSWVPSGLGAELRAADAGLDALRDPWLTYNGSELSMHVADGNDLRVAATDGSAGAWGWSPAPELTVDAPWGQRLGGPAIVGLGNQVLAFFDARPGEAEDGGAIARAITVDGLSFLAPEAPVILPSAPFTSLAQPSVFVDPVTADVRAWFSAFDGDRWQIATASSADGVTWSTPTPVVQADTSVGAPWVAWSAGAYRMVFALEQAGRWQFATATSIDGYAWSAPTLVHDTGEAVVAGARPPRPAVQLAPTSAWRLEGADAGALSDLYPEGGTTSLPDLGFSVRFASGFTVSTQVAASRSSGGVEPTSVAPTQGLDTLYATVFDEAGRPSLAALRSFAGGWGAVGGDLIPPSAGDNVLGAEAPVVFATPIDAGEGTSWSMLYAARDATDAPQLRRAWSDDGLTWVPDGRAPLADPPAMASLGVLPHAVVAEADGTLSLWYAGTDGGRLRIGRASSADGGMTFVADPGPDGDGVVFPPGPPGAWDDSGVRDPAPFSCTDDAGDPVEGMLYAGFDGANWAIGAAYLSDDVWVRRTSPFTGVEAPVLEGVYGTFAVAGVRSPVLADPSTCSWLLSGVDGATWRTGAASLRVGRSDLGATFALFPSWPLPQSGDTLTFTTLRGEEGTSVINLGQRVEQTALPGWDGSLVDDGPTAAAYDAVRGMLYVVAKGYPGVLAVDVRDDSTESWTDLNYLDLEVVLRMQTTTGALGFHDIVLDPSTDRLYLAAREPDAIYVVDLSGIEDDADKEILDQEVLGALPMKDLTDDAGDTTFAGVGSAGMALVPGQGLLIATHFRDNSVSVFDLRAGDFGEEIRYLPDVGENPHLARVTPDGRFALIANYLGVVTQGEVGSSLAVLDLRPDSPTWLQIITLVKNQVE